MPAHLSRTGTRLVGGFVLTRTIAAHHHNRTQGQQDVHDFLKFLLDKMDEEMRFEIPASLAQGSSGGAGADVGADAGNRDAGASAEDAAPKKILLESIIGTSE